MQKFEHSVNGFQRFHQNFQAQESNLYRHYVASTAERDGMTLLFLSSILCHTRIKMYKNLVMPFFDYGLYLYKLNHAFVDYIILFFFNTVLEAFLKYIY